MKKHQFLLFLFFLFIVGFNFYNIFVKIETEEKNYIENIGNSLKDRLLNINNIVKSGNGLYKYKDKYVYKGNANNYILFSNELWRIVSLESDGTIKIVKNDLIDQNLFDNYYNIIDNSKIVKHNFDISSVDISKLRTISDVENIKEEYEELYIGLLSVKDVTLASTNVHFDEYLDTYFWVNSKYNYLYLNDLWNLYGNVFVQGDFLKNGNTDKYRISVYLNKDLLLEKGNGTKSNPYIIKE